MAGPPLRRVAGRKARRNAKKRPGKRPGGRPLSKGVPALVSGRPLLSLAMMVKNEEAFLEDALRSARDWVDEMVVVDTGSTDRTVEIARDLGATVSFFEWPGSFSAARNVTLERATGRWLLILDADERFRSARPADLRKLLKPGPNFPFEAYMLNVVNTSLAGDVISSFYSIRVFPNDDRLRYQNVVHNRFGSIDPDNPTVFATRYAGTDIVHLGYDKEVYRARKKAERSLPLIEQVVAEQPEDALYRFYLGRELHLLGRDEEAVEALEETLRLMASGAQITEGEMASDGLVQVATHTLIDAYAVVGRPLEDSIAAAERALALFPTHPDIWFDLAQVYLRHERPAAGAEAMVRAIAHASDPAVMEGQAKLPHRLWDAWERLGHARWALQQFPEAYEAFLAALGTKPEDTEGWPLMLNCLCGLALELGDDPRLPQLLGMLLTRDDTSLGMFYFAVERLLRTQGADAARAMFTEGRSVQPRVGRDAEGVGLAAKLGIATGEAP